MPSLIGWAIWREHSFECRAGNASPSSTETSVTSQRLYSQRISTSWTLTSTTGRATLSLIYGLIAGTSHSFRAMRGFLSACSKRVLLVRLSSGSRHLIWPPLGPGVPSLWHSWNSTLLISTKSQRGRIWSPLCRNPMSRSGSTSADGTHWPHRFKIGPLTRSLSRSSSGAHCHRLGV